MVFTAYNCDNFVRNELPLPCQILYDVHNVNFCQHQFWYKKKSEPEGGELQS